jgi:hypothetical protein
VKGQAMLFHLILSIVTETGCSSIAEVRKENVLEHHNARTTNVLEHHNARTTNVVEHHNA